MTVQPPQFGKIIIRAVQQGRDGSEQFHIRLTGDECRLSPLAPQRSNLGDTFTLLVRRDGTMQAEYALAGRSIRGLKCIVNKDQILPLLAEMAKGVSPEDWQRVLADKNHGMVQLNAMFPGVTFENRYGDPCTDFAKAMRSTRDKLGLHDEPPIPPLHRRMWSRVEQLANRIK